MEYEEVITRLDAIRQKLENDLHWDNYPDTEYARKELEKNIEAVKYALNVLKENQ